MNRGFGFTRRAPVVALMASLGFSGRSYAVLSKYANYDAKSFGTKTQKIWPRLGFKY